MNAELFYKSFVSAIKDNEDECVRNYQDGKAFTKTIIPIIEGVLQSDGAETSREYYRIDIISWRDRRCEILESSPDEFQQYFWDLEAAVEHENYSEHWMDEVIKLAHINCPLRVVIGYLPADVSHNEYLNFVSHAINELRCKQDPDNQFLLIIGNSKTTDLVKYFQYKPYLFNGDAFMEPSDWQ